MKCVEVTLNTRTSWLVKKSELNRFRPSEKLSQSTRSLLGSGQSSSFKNTNTGVSKLGKITQNQNEMIVSEMLFMRLKTENCGLCFTKTLCRNDSLKIDQTIASSKCQKKHPMS